MKNGRDLGSYYISRRIEMLEDHLDKYRYRKHLWMYEGSAEYYSKKDGKGILNYLRPKLSEEEYFCFLAALVHSRSITNVIFIKNDGGLDLQELKIFVVEPLSKVTEERENSILGYRINTTLPNVIERKNERVTH